MKKNKKKLKNKNSKNICEWKRGNCTRAIPPDPNSKKNLAFSNLITPNELIMNPRLNQSIFIIQNRPNFPSSLSSKKHLFQKQILELHKGI